MRVAVIGANGKIGRLVCQKLKNLDGFEPVAFVREDDQVEFFTKTLGIKATLSSIENLTVEELGEIFLQFKIEGVVFTAGAGGKDVERIFTVDLDGCCKVAEACEKVKIPRIIVVSAIKAENRNFWYDTALRNYYIAKRAADHFIRGTGLDYTILQPGMLTHNQPTGKLCTLDLLETCSENFYSIDRADVAEFIVKILAHPKGSIRKTIPLANGGLDIDDFLKTLYD